MKIGFFIPNNVISHSVGCLMQGFHALGWEVHTNGDVKNALSSRGISTPFAVVPAEFLCRTEKNELPSDILLVDVSDGYGEDYDRLCKIAATKPVVLVNMGGMTNFWDYPDFFIVFTTHFNRLATREGRIFPLSFGLSEDTILLSNGKDLSQKRNIIIRNFSATFSQSVRNALDLMLVESLEKLFKVDRRKTDPSDYLAQLSEVAAVCAYGGEFVPDYWGYDYLRDRWEKMRIKTYKFKYMGASPVVLRWDSWRYFESSVMGCAPIQMDFNEYGFVWPINPEPWVHYIPVNLNSVSDLPQYLSDRVKDSPDFLIQIGRNARSWVIENYNPRKQAEYVLSVVQATWPEVVL
ncbi:MAG: hypothetical protein HQM08_10125 [Candidatus Riflebacteria bacterium]|nr:hypothetical protein [Candidatus Riflebacteria bacterium]